MIQGVLSEDGSVSEGSYYVSYFYPSKNLLLVDGYMICYYDKDKKFKSFERNTGSSTSVYAPHIPEDAEYVRIGSYSSKPVIAYNNADYTFNHAIRLYHGEMTNGVNNWWRTRGDRQDRMSSALHYGKCIIKCPEGCEILVYSDTDLNGIAKSSGFVKHDIVISEQVYWRVAAAKLNGTVFSEDEFVIKLEPYNEDLVQKIDDVKKETIKELDDIYKEELIYDGVIPDSGTFPLVQISRRFNAGLYTFRLERSVNTTPITVVFSKDNLNSNSRVIEIDVTDVFKVDISEEQAERINVLAFFAKRPNVPVNIKLFSVTGKVSTTLIHKTSNNRRLVGAIFFDGWSYRQWLDNDISDRIYQMSDLYRNSGNYNTPEIAAKYEAEFGKKMVLDEPEITGLDTNGGIDGSGNKLTSWIDYVWATTGEYPALSTSFCNYFPDVAYALRGRTYIDKDGNSVIFTPPHNHNYKPLEQYVMKDGVTTNGLTTVNLGWRNTDTLDQMEAQIDMASYYGIDYFAFCICLYPGMIKNGKVDEEAFTEGVKLYDEKERGWGTRRGNRALVNFMKAKNGYKMKFCLNILADYENVDDATFSIAMDYIYDKFISDKRYLHFNGRPVLLWHRESYGKSYSNIYHMNHDSILHFINGNKESFDGNFYYSGMGNAKIEVDHEDANGYKYYKYADSIQNAVSVVNPTSPMLIPLNLGWHSSQRANFVETDYQEIIPPTKNEVLQGLKRVYEAYSSGVNDCLILLYAWNECGEGGYLMPNQAEIDSSDPERRGFYKLEAVNEFKKCLL